MFRLFIALLALALASTVKGGCTAEISSLDDVSAAASCSTVNINSFTVPAGMGFNLQLATGATVNLNGNVQFGNKSWSGPLFTVSGESITFNGNGNTFDGGGPFYWDGLGGNGGIEKPAPMMKIEISGTFSDVVVVNSPERCYSVGSNPGPLVMSNLVVDDSQGDVPNAQSNGLPAGHNTDGFDVSTTNLIIKDSMVHNQDDCLAINKGSNIVFTGNTCINGHGISIGSITSNVTVSGVVISDNTITSNVQALRIKTDATATGSLVTNVTYSGNTGTGMLQFGVLIDQSFPDTLGTPGNGVIISDINFSSSESKIAVNSGADQVAVNCGSGSCQGKWNWADLTVTGGEDGPITNFTGIENFSQ
ncbi:polygalacturonase [Pluteus cervinus]|uniref:Polygalacturonase n=1 Tax=Pluteus cervinus TaxID=181527 RepID=A0ACD3B7L4_9AGAR|nr:polygalacturonase [Pluteus cervinus]